MLGSWFGSSPSGASPASFIERKTWPPALTWLAYALLWAEDKAERESGVWTQLQQALRHYDDNQATAEAGAHVPVDTALKVGARMHERVDNLSGQRHA